MNFGSLICSWNKGSTRGYWIPCWAVAVELFICLSLKGGSSWTSASQHTCLTEVLFFNISNIFILLKPGLTALRVLEKLCPLGITARSFFIIYLFGVLLRSKVNYKCLCHMRYSSFPRPMSSASCYFAVKKFPKKASRSVFTEGVCAIQHVLRQPLNPHTETTVSNWIFLICHMLNKISILVISKFWPYVILWKLLICMK